MSHLSIDEISADFTKQAVVENISRSVGTRNKLVHEYDSVDQKQIYASIKDCLADYTQYCAYLLTFLHSREGTLIG